MKHNRKGCPWMRRLSRRRFLEYTGAATGLYLARQWLKAPSLARANGTPRVVSVRGVGSDGHNATNWDHSTGYHWEYIDQQAVNTMIAIGITTLTDESTVQAAWSALIPYEAGQAVAIKVNFNNSWGCVSGHANAMDAYPETVNPVIEGLVSIGVPANKIWIADPSRAIATRFIDGIDESFRDEVQYYGRTTCSDNSYVASYVDATLWPAGNASPTTHPPGDVVRPAQVFADAAHLINIPLLKGHGPGHMTLSMKNHFGSVTFSGSDHDSERGRMHDYLEPYLNQQHDLQKSILADISNNPHIRDKTRLVIGDGLFGHPTINYGTSIPVTWQCFNDEDPNILFFGTDFVATDSVMLDYIQEEQSRLGLPSIPGWNGPVIHSSLHHAASMTPPLGVHDHWDSFETKQYSSIDYIQSPLPVAVPTHDESVPTSYSLLQNVPNPFNRATTIRYQLPEPQSVSLVVHNVLGKPIRSLASGKRDAGAYSVVWDGRDELGRPMGSGMYVVRMVAGQFTQARRMTLIQ